MCLICSTRHRKIQIQKQVSHLGYWNDWSEHSLGAFSNNWDNRPLFSFYKPESLSHMHCNLELIQTFNSVPPFSSPCGPALCLASCCQRTCDRLGPGIESTSDESCKHHHGFMENTGHVFKPNIKQHWYDVVLSYISFEYRYIYQYILKDVIALMFLYHQHWFKITYTVSDWSLVYEIEVTGLFIRIALVGPCTVK